MGKKRKTKLENGKFYMAYGGNAHPAQIYERTEIETYKSIKFGTSKRKHMTEIRPIQKGIAKSFVQNRPFEGVRSDYGDKELQGLNIDKKDIELIERIKLKETRKSKKAQRKYEK